MRDDSEKMKMAAERKIAVFDLDGTLVETDAANYAAYCAALYRWVAINQKVEDGNG